MLRFPFFRTVLLLLAAAGIFVVCFERPAAVGQASPWKEADEGLLVAEFESHQKNANPFYSITVVKIDPKDYSFRLLCATEYGKEKLTAREWCERHKLLAAVNAGMFQEDGLTSVGYMRNFKHVNNPRLGKANSVLAFNPVEPVEDEIPEIQIIDRECRDFASLRPKYHTFIQSIRMVSCEGQNVWSQQHSKWSTLAIGMDTDGKMLFIFSRTPQSVHDFIETILSLPLSLKSAMYLEGGPQASLYLSTPKMTLERNGAWEGFEENNAFQFALPIPNVIGITRRVRVKS
ncbi:MAG: phosphodiester glycosidase family protein [Syntrophobacteraceae bacterium]